MPETWEECHEVLCELENVKAGTRGFNASRAAAKDFHCGALQSQEKAIAKETQLQKQLDAVNKQLKSGGLDGGKRKKDKGEGKTDGKGSDGPRIDPNTGRTHVCWRCGKKGPVFDQGASIATIHRTLVGANLERSRRSGKRKKKQVVRKALKRKAKEKTRLS